MYVCMYQHQKPLFPCWKNGDYKLVLHAYLACSKHLMNGKHNYYNLVKQHVLGIKGSIFMLMNPTLFAQRAHLPTCLNSTRMPVRERPQLAPRSDHTLPPAACSGSQQQPARLGSKPKSQSQLSNIIQGTARSWKPPG